MKIGAFAAKNNTTIDTIRHYMSLELIVPEKIGGQYVFDARCTAEYEDVQSLKALGFSLAEMQKILAFKRIGKMTAYEKSQYYRSIFTDKLNAIDLDIKALKASKKRVQGAIDALEVVQDPSVPFGIPLSVVGQLVCPVCGKSLVLDQGAVQNGQVMTGILNCDTACRTFEIVDGIIVAPSGVIDLQDAPYPFDMDAYVAETDPSYLGNIYKGMTWVQKNVPFEKFGGMNMLELGTGHGFFLRNFLEELPADCFYFGIDHDIERLKWLKTHLEGAGVSRSVVLIACDFGDIPLKHGIADVLIDYTGSSNYAFEHEDFLLEKVSHWMNQSTTLLASFITFERFSTHSKIPPAFQGGFRAQKILEAVDALGFERLSGYASDYMDKGGVYEDYFVKGERVAVMGYYGKRKSQKESEVKD